MGTFSINGYTRERLNDWQTKLKNIWFGVFGTSIDLSDDTMDGQLIGATAESLSNQDQQVEFMSKVCDPAQAQGTYLSTLVKINGIQRIQASHSNVTLTLTGINGTVIAAGSRVRSATTQEVFITDNAATIAATTASVTATAVNSGAVAALAGTVTIIDTQIPGWTSVTNASAATVGINQESDSALRVRRANSVALAGTGNVDAVRGALLSIDSVTAAIVNENDTSSTVDSVPAHSIACVVSGGDGDTIAETILLKKSSGCSTYGTTTANVTDSQGFTKAINYSRPSTASTLVYVNINYTYLGDEPTDFETQIKTALVDYFSVNESTRLYIGDDVIYSELYVPLNALGNVSITSLTLGFSATPTGTSSLTVAWNQLAVFDAARITFV